MKSTENTVTKSYSEGKEIVRKIPFNKPYLSGPEFQYMKDAMSKKHISGNGKYSKLCQKFYLDTYGFENCLLTSSCTDALEMCAILADIKSGDEIIMPSYTFVSTANAFVLRGAKIIFADSEDHHPNIDLNHVQELISDKTKAIVVVHYGGVACDMDKLSSLAKQKNIIVIEDAAHSFDAHYKGKPLGSFGDLATFSFHETKNIVCGEGGLLVINNEKYVKRAEIIWEKGTNRSAFWRGEVDKYSWVDMGSSFLPSDLTAAFLYGQLENYKSIQAKRVKIWNRYHMGLKKLVEEQKIYYASIPDYASNNGHIFYFLTRKKEDRTGLLKHLKAHRIDATFHYLPLHKSAYYLNTGNKEVDLKNCERFAENLIRLPLFFELSESDQDIIIKKVKDFFD